MNESGTKNPAADLSQLGLGKVNNVFWNLSQTELAEKTIQLNLGVLSDTGALAIKTGEFTGRAPKDKFIVKDAKTSNTVHWGDVNIAYDENKFQPLYDKLVAYLGGKDVFVKDARACANDQYRLNVRVISELPWASMFAGNMFIRPGIDELKTFSPDWLVIHAPGFHADPKIDGTRQHNFAVLNFTRKIIIIGGTGYTGEIKKGIFTVLNYWLPQEQNVLSMHCSANIGKQGDTAVFFGLSGTGKTTLSADPNRGLIGDDEHGWSDDGVFNFEGGCYAKCIDLTEEKEPEIFRAIKFGSILENIGFFPGTRTVNYADIKLTENTRVSYPIDYIDNAVKPSTGGIPKNIFFLTCDAFGVLPPISRLDNGQAMYHFISGYTAKVAGTEMGITEPTTTFSACFGKAFLPLHPAKYAELLGKKLNDNPEIKVWLVNTGWSGGSYGVGSRMKLSYTRAMITAALNGEFDNVEFEELPIFRLSVPKSCSGVPAEILNPRLTWADKAAFDHTANELANKFVKNFAQYADSASPEILAAAPASAVVA